MTAVGSGQWCRPLASGAGARADLMRAYRVSFIAHVVTGKLACPWSLRAPEEIWADLRALEQEAEGLLEEIWGGAD